MSGIEGSWQRISCFFAHKSKETQDRGEISDGTKFKIKLKLVFFYIIFEF